MELVTDLTRDAATSSGAYATDMEKAASMQVDPDDSLTLDCSAVAGVMVAAEACEDGTLHIHRHAVSWASAHVRLGFDAASSWM